MLQDIESNQKFELLKTLLLEANKELVFWRERNWAALRDVVGALIAVAGISLFQADAAPALVLLVMGLAIITTVYLRKNLRRYDERLKLRARIETALGVFDKSVFLEGDSLYPEELLHPAPAKGGSYSFIAIVWIIAVATILAMILTWFVKSDRLRQMLFTNLLS